MNTAPGGSKCDAEPCGERWGAGTCHVTYWTSSNFAFSIGRDVRTRKDLGKGDALEHTIP